MAGAFQTHSTAPFRTPSITVNIKFSVSNNHLINSKSWVNIIAVYYKYYKITFETREMGGGGGVSRGFWSRTAIIWLYFSHFYLDIFRMRGNNVTVVSAVVALLVIVGGALSSVDGKHHHHHHQHQHQHKHNNNKLNEKDDVNELARLFGAPGREYHFRYDAQTTSGYAPWISTQRAINRLQVPYNFNYMKVCSLAIHSEHEFSQAYQALLEMLNFLKQKT